MNKNSLIQGRWNWGQGGGGTDLPKVLERQYISKRVLPPQSFHGPLVLSPSKICSFCQPYDTHQNWCFSLFLLASVNPAMHIKIGVFLYFRSIDLLFIDLCHNDWRINLWKFPNFVAYQNNQTVEKFQQYAYDKPRHNRYHPINLHTFEILFCFHAKMGLARIYVQTMPIC